MAFCVLLTRLYIREGNSRSKENKRWKQKSISIEKNFKDTESKVSNNYVHKILKIDYLPVYIQTQGNFEGIKMEKY